MNRQQPRKPISHLGIVGRSMEIASVADEALAVAWTGYPVLITGETGVGKGLLAKAIHQASGCKGRLVVVNVAGLDDHLFSDTLFGHHKAAYSGADRKRDGLIKTAEGGTLFLDEIGDLSIAGQLKLLRVFDDGEYLPLGADRPEKTNTRIVLATNRNLQQLIKEKAFRQDLYHRITLHHIDIPPLRRRRNDIPLLLDHFLEEISEQFGRPMPSVSPASLKRLMAYDFPGNVRELRSIIVNAVARHRDPNRALEIHIDDNAFKPVPADSDFQTPQEPESADKGDLLDFSGPLPTLKETEERLIAEALRRSGGVQTAAASMLGITQQALSQRLQRKDKMRKRRAPARRSAVTSS